MGELDGKIALVTGGASGIGKATAERFVAEGARVFVADRNEAGIGALIGQLGHNQADGAVTDVRDEAAVEKMVAGCVRRFGRVDIAVNAAGVGDLMPLVDLPLARFRRVLDVCLAGVFLSVKHEARQMVKAGAGGSIVNIASVNGRVPAKGFAAYGTAKAGVVMLTQVAALELAGHAIRVNAIGPGLTETPMAAQIMASVELRRAFQEATPLGTAGQPEDVARLALYLASDASRLMTGQTLYLDGGLSLGQHPDIPGVLGDP